MNSSFTAMTVCVSLASRPFCRSARMKVTTSSSRGAPGCAAQSCCQAVSTAVKLGWYTASCTSTS